MSKGNWWPKFTSHTTNIKRRAAERKAKRAEKQMEAQGHAMRDRVACDSIMCTTLDGRPVNPEWRAWAEDRVSRRWSLRMGSRSW